jgi:hypothetical protein
VWNAARQQGQTALARELKGARYALWKNPEDLTGRQRTKLAWIAQVNQRLYRAWLLKEELRLVFKLKGVRATVLLEAWLAWARRCRIPAFVKLARSITEHRAAIQAASRMAVQRAGRVGQHQDPPADPGSVRLQVARRAHRFGPAQRRRAVPAATPVRLMTHGSRGRASFFGRTR